MSLLPDRVVSIDGCWTWFNSPPVYDAARQRTYAGWIRNNGRVRVSCWRGGSSERIYRIGRPRGATDPFLERDDHDDPGLLVLASGRVLACYSQHNGKSYAAYTDTDGDVRSWTEVEVNDASTYDEAYAWLWQAGDDDHTVYWIFRRDDPTSRPRYFRTSTDDGATWSSATALVAYSTHRPYLQAVGNGPNRLDIFTTQGQPGQIATSLYHFYMEVASDGTRSYYKSDGTLIGDDSDLPIDPTTDATLVYDGSSIRAWGWDIRIIDGAPVVAFASFETVSSDYDTHHYYQGRWSGSAWVLEEVCEGGDTGTTPHYLYSGELNYSGGLALDPNDADTVYVSRKYGSADWRIERWEHTGTFGSGSWSKAADISGNTGTVNARPRTVDEGGTTRLYWWSGAYTSYIAYDTQVHCDPPLDWRKAKPGTPAWTPAEAPAGAQAYYLLHEGSGNPSDLTGNGYDGSAVGSPTWASGDGGDFGPYLTGLGTSHHYRIDSLAAALDAVDSSSFPQWIACLYKSTSSTSNQYIMGLGSSSSNTPIVGMVYQGSTPPSGFWRDDSGSAATPGNSFIDPDDGEFHALVFVRESSTYAYTVGDGKATNSSPATTGTTTIDRGAIGCLMRGSAVAGFGGEIHAIAVGWGAVDDPESLAYDFLRGQFAGTFAVTSETAKSASDSATLTEAATVAVTLAASDTASLAESGAIAATAAGSDSATVTEAATIAVTLAASDTASLAESGALAAALSGSDAGSLSEESWALGGRLRRAARFNGSTGDLSAADAAALRAGDVDCWWALWVRLEAKSSDRPLLTKWSSIPNREYQIAYVATVDRLRLAVTPDGTSAAVVVHADTFGSPPTGTWLFVMAYHDAEANRIAISVNGGPFDSADHSGGILSGSNPLVLGAFASGVSRLAGDLDDVVWGKAPSGGIGLLAPTIRDALYNSGAGLPAGSLSASQRSDWGVISAWSLDESSGTRLDAWGGQHLTPTSGVTRAVWGLLAGTETPTATDSTATLAASLSAADTASAADSGSIFAGLEITASDSATLSEAVGSLAASLTGTDAGTLAEASSLDTGSTTPSASDAATLSEAASLLVTIVAADTFTATETGSIPRAGNPPDPTQSSAVLVGADPRQSSAVLEGPDPDASTASGA